MTEKVFVFSDETGQWNDDGFYIRSWIAISEEEYYKLDHKIRWFKNMNNIKYELKFSHGHDYSIFSDLTFKVYFTITFCQDFKQRRFDLITNVDTQSNESFTINNRNIKEKILNTIKNAIFHNIYEFYHIKNVVDFLRESFSDSSFLFFVDKPQCQNKDWKESFNEITGLLDSTLNIINKSENDPGIQFADIVVGNLKNILNEIDRYNKGLLELNSFEKKIVSNFSQSNGPNKKFMNNPQIIMWKSEHEGFVNKLKRLMGISNGS